MDITIKLNLPVEKKATKTCETLEQFKVIHKELLDNTQGLYDALTERLAAADELVGKDGKVEVDKMPEFLGVLYHDLLALKLNTSILLDLLSENPKLLEHENFIEDLLDVCDNAEEFLSSANEMFDSVLFGMDEDDGDGAVEEDGNDGEFMVTIFRIPARAMAEEEQEGAEDSASKEAGDENGGPAVVCKVEGDMDEVALEAVMNKPEVAAAMQSLVDVLHGALV